MLHAGNLMETWKAQGRSAEDAFRSILEAIARGEGSEDLDDALDRKTMVEMAAEVLEAYPCER